MAVGRNFALDKCELNQTRITVVLKISTFAYCFEFIFLNESLQMEKQPSEYDVRRENDVECLRNVRIIFVATNFADVIILRRHEQNDDAHDLHSTTVYFRFSRISPSNGKPG